MEYDQAEDQMDEASFRVNHEVYAKSVLQYVRTGLDEITTHALFNQYYDRNTESEVKAWSFQEALKFKGCNVNMWEVFVIFDHVNRISGA